MDNPYTEYLQERRRQRNDKTSSYGKIKHPESRYLKFMFNEEEERQKRNPFMMQMIQRVEKRELQQEINEIVNRLDSVPTKLHNNYLKRTDINDFNNYKQVMHDLKVRREKA